VIAHARVRPFGGGRTISLTRRAVLR